MKFYGKRKTRRLIEICVPTWFANERKRASSLNGLISICFQILQIYVYKKKEMKNEHE